MHVIAPSPAGGAESVVVALASARPTDTGVIILDQLSRSGDPPHPIAEQLRGHGVQTEEVRCGRRRYGDEVRAVEQLLRNSKAQVVHTHGYHGTWVGYYAATRVGAATVATVHGYLTRTLKERLYNVIDRRMLRRFDVVIAVSRGIHDQLVRSGIAAHRIQVIQNGMTGRRTALSREAARDVLHVADDVFVCGWVGRLSPEKGADLFLEALARADGQIVGVIVGDGPESSSLAQLAVRLGLDEHRLRFAGFIPSASSTLAAFDAIALTSRLEGTPMVILEAIGAGVPIIAFAIGGIPDLLGDDTAWLVPGGNVQAFAMAIRDAATSESERRKRATAAQQRLPVELTPAGWLERTWLAYERALEARR